MADQLIATPPAVPSSPGAPIVGNLFEYRSNPLTFMERMRREMGDTVLVTLMGMPLYLVFHPDAVGEVLVKQADKFHKSEVYKTNLADYLGNGLLISDGAFWKRQRKLAQPAFHTGRISAYADTMVMYADEMASSWQHGEVRDVAQEMMMLTSFIVAKTMFDVDVRGDTKELSESLETLVMSVTREFYTLLKVPSWMPSAARRRKEKAISILHGMTMRFITERRRTMEDTGDLMSMLLLAQDDEGIGMTDEQVRDEVLTIFLAGHETTANALAWVWYLLSENPEVRATLDEELDRVLGGRLPTLADLPALKYTEQVFSETLRLYPPAFNIGREAIEDVQIGGYNIPRGATVLLVQYITQRDERWWPDPEVFRPERFSDDSADEIRKYSYFPFAAGPRVCIGNSFAVMEGKLLLATIAQRWRLNLVEGHPIQPDPLVTLRPRYGVSMNIVSNT